MNKQEFFAAVKAYKEGKPLQPKVSHDYTIDDWADQYYDQAVALKAKALLAHSCDRPFDADIYNQQLGILTHMLDGMDESAEILADIESDAKEVLEHGEWKKHKYIRIENGRYIYEDQKDRDKRDTDIARNEKIASTARSYSKGMNDRANEREKIANGVEVIGEHTKAFKEVNLDIAKADRQKANEMSEDARNYQRTANELKRVQNQPVIRDDDLKDQERQRNESAAKAQKEGEAMQAWKNRKEAAKSGSGESYEKAQKEGEAQQAWKNVQAQKETLKNQTGSNNAKNQAESSMEGYESWKKDQAAKKRFEEGKAATIDRVAELESGIRKEEFDNELQIRKQALADANVDQKSIDDAKARKAEAIRAKDDNSKNQAQSEGEAMQAWKNAKKASESKERMDSEESSDSIWKKKVDAYEAREDSVRKAATADDSKKAAYEANAKGAKRTADILANREIQARAAEWNAKSQEERNKEIAEYEKQIKSSRARMRVLAQFESDAAEYARQHDAEVVMESYDPQTGYANKISVVKKNPGNGKHEDVLNTFFIKSESYSDDDWINQAKQDGLSEKVEEDWKREKEGWDKRAGFKHSSISPLSGKEYYAAIAEYKRKKV